MTEKRMSWFEFVRSDAPLPKSLINEEIVPEPEPEPKSARERADRRWGMEGSDAG
jgi:hypothetical protein